MIRRISILAGVFLGAALTFAQTPAPATPDATTPPATPVPGASPTPSTPPRPKNFRSERYVGTLIRVDGTNMILNAHLQNGVIKEVTVPTDAQTEFRINNKIGGLADLKPDMLIRAMRMSMGAAAGRLRVQARDFELSGGFVKLDGTNLYMTAQMATGGSRETRVPTDTNTQVVIATPDPKGGAPKIEFGKIEDLQRGDRLIVSPAKGIAMRITVTQSANKSTPPPDAATTNAVTGTNSAPAK